MHFGTIGRASVPSGRSGKHKSMVTAILSDLDQLKPGSALRISLKELGDSKENIRSALNRATRKAGLMVSTASDDEFFYVWNGGSK